MSALDDFTASMSEVPLFDAYRKQAADRLDRAQRRARASAGAMPSIRGIAARELMRALAVAEEWGVAGRAGRR